MGGGTVWSFSSTNSDEFPVFFCVVNKTTLIEARNWPISVYNESHFMNDERFGNPENHHQRNAHNTVRADHIVTIIITWPVL